MSIDFSIGSIVRLLACAAALFSGARVAIAQTSIAGKPLTEQIASCVACHGEGGVATAPEVPSLASQQALFLTNQLILFREGLRKSELMSPFAKGLHDDEIIQLSEYFAKLPLTRTIASQQATTIPDTARLKRAADLVRAHRCDSCHLPTFSGRDQIPRISGQREDYLSLAMRQYRDSQRVGSDTSMIAAMYGISDADIEILAYYLARATNTGR